MAFIDTSYFNGNLLLTDKTTASDGDFSSYIERNEKKYLVKALGFDLYTAFITGIAEAAPDQKWLDIQDGKVYEVNGIKREWIGLKNDEKQSFLAYFIYCDRTAELPGTTGDNSYSIAKLETNEQVDQSFKIVTEYNRGVDLYNELLLFIYNTNLETPDTYPNWYPEELQKMSKFGI